MPSHALMIQASDFIGQRNYFSLGEECVLKVPAQYIITYNVYL